MLRADMRLIPDGQIDADVRIRVRPLVCGWLAPWLPYLFFVMRFFPQVQAHTR